MNRGITALTLLALAGTAHAQAPGTAPYVQVGTVTKGKDAVARRSIGHTEAIRYVTVTSAVEGHLQKPQFKEGSIVRKGDILFEIEPIRYKAAVQKAQATVDEIEAKLAYAEANYQRKSKLGVDRLTSAENLDTAKAQLEGAVLSNPAWQQLTAVREGDYYYMDKSLYHLKPNARWGEAYDRLVEILYGV